METLKDLRNTYKKLQEESNNIYSKIRKLEKKEVYSKYTVGNCYVDKTWNDLVKIVSIKDHWISFIRLKRDFISRHGLFRYSRARAGRVHFSACGAGFAHLGGAVIWLLSAHGLAAGQRCRCCSSGFRFSVV